jgi:uncharacterized membrane protein YvlD (DUF360 family)
MISRIGHFYGEQLRVLWEWRGGRVALLKRLVITLVVATISFIATAAILPRMTIDRPVDAVLAIIAMALFNAIVRPVVLALAAPVSLILVGILVLVLQVVAFLVVAQFAPGVHVDSFGTALIGSFIYAIINTILTAILGVDRGDSYYGLLIQRLMVQRATGHTDKPGLVIIQIDGLAHPILAARMRAGSVNTLAGLVRDGSHKLSRWEAILPSMTSGSQAGILHGNNDGIPAFRWYERDRKHLMASSNPADAMLIASRISNGEGLLSNNGASICNLLNGDATRAYMTTATIKAEGGGIGDSNAFLSFFFSPTAYLRSFTLFLGEFSKELIQARRTRRSGIRPQMHRGLKYAGMRAASNTLLRDVNTSLIIDEMYRGTNVIYADFTDYDELAHHCGPERVESLQALDGVDSAIATLIKATEEAPRPYKFIVLSDHGQSLGETFLQRYGVSLGEYIRELMGGRATIVQSKSKAEGSAFVNSLLSEITQAKGVGPTVARAALANKTDADGMVNLDDVEEEPPVADATTIAVVGSGNLGLVWFTGHDHRLTVEELEELHPGLVASVAAHPGIGLLMVRSKEFGAVVFGPNGTRFLDQDKVEGDDPTELFGPHTVMSLKREDAMLHAPDLLLLSQYNPDLGEVAAFEELIGSHGGLGGPQTEPFILHPVEWELDEDVPLGAPAVYRNIRRWLASIGIALGPQGAEAATTAASTAGSSGTDDRAPEPAPVA